LVRSIDRHVDCADLRWETGRIRLATTPDVLWIWTTRKSVPAFVSVSPLRVPSTPPRQAELFLAMTAPYGAFQCARRRYRTSHAINSLFRHGPKSVPLGAALRMRKMSSSTGTPAVSFSRYITCLAAPWRPDHTNTRSSFGKMSHHIPINTPIEDIKDTSKHFEEGTVDQEEQHALQQFDPKLRKQTMLKVSLASMICL
jgi:hypothetical protein